MTLYDIADDVGVALGFTHDDALLGRIARAYNAKIAIDKIKDQIITKSYATDIRQVSDMLETFVVDVNIHTADDVVNWDYMSFDLPVDLYSLPHDGGLAWVRYHRNSLPQNCPPQLARTVFTHTTLGALSGLYDMQYQMPCDTRPYVARDKYRVYVFGVQPQVTKLHVGLFAALPNLEDMDPEAEVDIPAEYLLAVKKMVIDASRFSLQLPERLRNDGRDIDQPIRTERQVSLNDPLNIEQV